MDFVHDDINNKYHSLLNAPEFIFLFIFFTGALVIDNNVSRVSLYANVATVRVSKH